MNARAIVRNLASFALAGVFLYLAFRDTDFASLWSTMLQADLGWVLSLVPIVVLSHWIRAVRWRYLLMPFKERPSYRNMFSAVMLGYAVNNILPRVGEVVRGVVIGKLEQISRSSAFGTVVIERILDFLTFSFLVGATVSIYPSAIDPFVDDPAAWRPIFLAASIGAVVVFFFLFIKLEALVTFVSRYRHRFPMGAGERIGRILDSFVSGLSVAHLRRTWPMVLGWSLAMWFFYALGLYVPFFMFDSIAALNLGFGEAVVLLVISSVAWALPAPGAMGTYHSFLTIAMVKLYGADPTAALGLSVITHEVGYVLVMAIGAYYYVADHGRVGSMTSNESSSSGS
ncbi:MAG: flippase-like domain-containing protein [Bacteroidetes bacterium]|nr:flippase-like domain-containing protein [Bacteroidota bacterium]